MRYIFGLLLPFIVPSVSPMAILPQKLAISERAQPDKIRLKYDVFRENERIQDIFLSILRGTGLPGGLAQFLGCSDLPTGRLSMKQGATVREAMDALVAGNPSFQWNLQDGVINLVPRGEVPLLRTRIARFRMEAKDIELPLFFQDLLMLPEVRDREATLGLKKGLGQGGGPGAVDEHPVPKTPLSTVIDVQNVSLQDAFNKVVAASPKWVWFYYETSCNGENTYVVNLKSDY